MRIASATLPSSSTCLGIPTMDKGKGVQESKKTNIHPFDFYILKCIHFAKPELPPEIREKVYHGTLNLRKELHKMEQGTPYRGLSKSAAKRRAKHYEKCIKCGNWSHEGNCSKNQTYAQFEYTQLIQLGAIRLQAERSIRKDSNVFYAVKQELELIRDKFWS